MKEGMRTVEKVRRSDGLWCWLCTDGQGEWATYIGIMDSPKYTGQGHYFRSEEEARKDFAKRQIPPEICWSDPPKSPRKHTRAIVNNTLYEVAVYEDNRRTLVCEDVNHPTIKGYFDEEKMAYYTPEGYKIILDGCREFREFVESGIPIPE